MLIHWVKTIWAKGGGISPSWGPTIIFSEKNQVFLIPWHLNIFNPIPLHQSIWYGAFCNGQMLFKSYHNLIHDIYGPSCSIWTHLVRYWNMQQQNVMVVDPRKVWLWFIFSLLGSDYHGRAESLTISLYFIVFLSFNNLSKTYLGFLLMQINQLWS